MRKDDCGPMVGEFSWRVFPSGMLGSSGLAAQPLPPRPMPGYERALIALGVLTATEPTIGLPGKTLAFVGEERRAALRIVRAALGMSDASS